MARTVFAMSNSIDQALRDAHDSRDDDSGHPAAFREVYEQWMQFRAAQLKAVLREAGYAEGANQGDRATVLLLAAIPFPEEGHAVYSMAGLKDVPTQHELTAATVRSEYLPNGGGGANPSAGITTQQFQALMQRMGQLEQSQATKDQKIKDLEARLADKENDSDAQQGAIKLAIEEDILALHPKDIVEHKSLLRQERSILMRKSAARFAEEQMEIFVPVAIPEEYSKRSEVKSHSIKFTKLVNELLFNMQRKMAEQQRVNITTAQMFKNFIDTFYEKDDDDEWVLKDKLDAEGVSNAVTTLESMEDINKQQVKLQADDMKAVQLFIESEILGTLEVADLTAQKAPKKKATRSALAKDITSRIKDKVKAKNRLDEAIELDKGPKKRKKRPGKGKPQDFPKELPHSPVGGTPTERAKEGKATRTALPPVLALPRSDSKSTSESTSMGERALRLLRQCLRRRSSTQPATRKKTRASRAASGGPSLASLRVRGIGFMLLLLLQPFCNAQGAAFCGTHDIRGRGPYGSVDTESLGFDQTRGYEGEGHAAPNERVSRSAFSRSRSGASVL